MDLLTLDTNVVRDLWRDDARWRDDVEQILELARSGAVEIAVSRHIDNDITDGNLAEQLHQLLQEGVLIRSQGLFIFGESTFDGGDRFGDQAIIDLEVEMRAIHASGQGPVPPERDDWLLMHAHAVYFRDYFLTRDGGILRLADELADVGITVLAPRDYLALRSAGLARNATPDRPLPAVIDLESSATWRDRRRTAT